MGTRYFVIFKNSACSPPFVILNLFQDNMRRLFFILKQVQDDDGVKGGGRNPLLALIHNLCLRITQRFAQSL